MACRLPFVISFLTLLAFTESSPASTYCYQDNVLRALQHRTPDSYAFCNSYISQPPATTVTVFTSTYTDTVTAYIESTRHPAYLFNLQRWSSSQTPITYTKASPTPSKVPGGACYYPSGGFCNSPANVRRAVETFEKRVVTTTTTTTTSDSSVPSYLATVPPSRISSGCSCLGPPYSTTATVTTDDYTQVTQTCTSYSPSQTTVVPAFCAPTAQVNAPAILSVANLTTVKPFAAPDKLSCCGACANTFNCVWWKFNFAKSNADGSGDPWRAGTCTFAFNAGYYPNTDWGNTGAICPNGKVNAIDSKYSFSGKELANSLGGYNHGACGNPVGEFQSSQDFGFPDGVYSDLICPAST